MKLKKTVLVFDTFARMGGGLSYLKNIAGALSSRGDRFKYVFLCNPAIKNEITSLNSGAEVVFGPSTIAGGGVAGFLRRKKLLLKAVNTVKPDVVLCMNQCDSPLPVPSVLFLRNPLYFAMKERYLRRFYSTKQLLINHFWRWQTIKSVHNASHILTSTAAFYEMVAKDLGPIVSRKPASVAPFGLNQLTQSAAPRDYSNAKRLLCLQYNFYKGFESLIHAVRILVDRGILVELIITDTLENHFISESRRVWNLITELSLHDHIKCIGKVPHQELAQTYAESDIFVFPSLLESFGHGLLEAMGNGMPCVSSDLSTSRELGGDCVIYHKTNDPVDCAEKIMHVIKDASLRGDLGKRAQQRSRLFSWDHHVEALEQVFERLC